MDIQILHLIEGARAARGTAVVIDVFRAFTVEAYLAKNGTLRLCGYDMACDDKCPHYKNCLNDKVQSDYEIFLAWLKRESE